MQHIRWQRPEPPSEAAIRACYREQGLSPYAWSNGPGERYGIHRHTYNKVLYCVRGSIRFMALGQEIDLGAGDCLILPAGIAHGALVGEQGVMCLEAHQE